MLTEERQRCKNHPDRVAKRRCFYCGEFLCPECQQIAFHHLFCGTACKTKFLLRQVAHSLLSVPIAVFRTLFGTRSPLRKIGFRGVFDLVLLALLAGCLLLLTRIIDRTVNLEQRLAELGSGPPASPAEIIKPEKLRIDAPGPRAAVYTNIFDIEGEADKNQIISLSSDEQLLAVTMPRGGKFRFADVRAKRGRNRFVVKAMSGDGVVNTLETIDFYYGPRPLAYMIRSFDRGPTDQKKIALTFDGGSSNNVTEEILDALSEKGIRCTMFLTGGFMRRYPELVKRVVADGHEIGNHTWSHPHLTTFAEDGRHQTRPGITREFLHRELQSTAELFRSLTGTEMAKLWRAPFGEHNSEIRTWAAETGYRQVGWTLGRDQEHSMDTLDWVADKSSSVYRTSEEIAEKIINFGVGDPRGANGAIILMHLGTERIDDQPHKMVPEIVDRMRASGYTFATISELM